MRTIVIGVGNPILGDDGIGLHIVRELKDILEDPAVVIEEAFTGGLNLLDLIVGYDRAVIVDAISMDDREIGEVMVLDARKMQSAHSMNPHDVSFPEALELAEKMGEKKIPGEITIVAVNIAKDYEFSEDLSDAVRMSVPLALDEINRLL